MILPNKNIELKSSLVGIGANILEHIRYSPVTVSALWEMLKVHDRLLSFEKYILSLNFLYLSGVIDLSNGTLAKVRHEN